MVKVSSLGPSPFRTYSFDKIDEQLTAVGRTIDPDRGKNAAALQPGAFIAVEFPLNNDKGLQSVFRRKPAPDLIRGAVLVRWI